MCSADLRYALSISVHDSATGAPTASGTVISAALQGSTPQVVDVPSDARFDAEPIVIGTSPGTFDVVVRKANYRDWTRTIVVKSSDGGCHPDQVSVDARLQRLP